MSRRSTRKRSSFSEWDWGYCAIFNAANDAIFVHDLRTGQILDINRKGCEMYGYTAAEMRQLTIEDLSSGQPPYTQQYALELVNQVATGDPMLFEWEAKHKSGRLFWVEVNLKRAHLGGRDTVLAVVRDITDRKRADEALMRAEKLASIGLLAANIAHEINDPLSVAVNTIFLAKTNLTETEIVKKSLDIADAELRCIAHLLSSRVLDSYRESAPPTMRVPSDVADSARDFMRNEMNRKRTAGRKDEARTAEVVSIDQFPRRHKS